MDIILEITYPDLRKSFVSYTKLFICKDSMGVEGTKTNWNGWEIGLSVDTDIVNKRINKQTNHFQPSKKKSLIDQEAEDIQGEEAILGRIIFAIVFEKYLSKLKQCTK